MAIQWETKEETKFKKQYKRLDSQIKQRVSQAIQELVKSENPSDLGVYKPDMRVFAYNVGKYRILYNIRYSENKIDLHRVCDHKSVYNKD
jgi:mRNA-degrading endonuclease RelE of RelBE toxin-antitoxin system